MPFPPLWPLDSVVFSGSVPDHCLSSVQGRGSVFSWLFSSCAFFVELYLYSLFPTSPSPCLFSVWNPPPLTHEICRFGFCKKLDCLKIDGLNSLCTSLIQQLIITSLDISKVTSHPLNCNSAWVSSWYCQPSVCLWFCLSTIASWRADTVTYSSRVLNIMPKC